jgi:hypothetical protein
MRVIAKGIGEELFGSADRVVDVFDRHTVSAGEELGGDSWLNRFPILVQNPDGGVGDRPSDRNRGSRESRTW